MNNTDQGCWLPLTGESYLLFLAAFLAGVLTTFLLAFFTVFFAIAIKIKADKNSTFIDLLGE